MLVDAGRSAITSRVEIGTPVAQQCNPALLAKMADTVDDMSDGRLILGIGAGWNEAEYRVGIPFDHRVGRFEEGDPDHYDVAAHGSGRFHGNVLPRRGCRAPTAGTAPAGPPIWWARTVPACSA